MPPGRRGAARSSWPSRVTGDAKVFGDAELLTTADPQPGRQRRRLLRPRHPGRASAVRCADGLVEVDVTDQGQGIPHAEQAPHLRALLPRRRGPLAGHRRHRPRPGHRQAHLRQPRRRRHRVERGGPRVHLHHAAARRARQRTAVHDPGGHRRRAAARRRAARLTRGHPMTRILVVEDEESFSDPLSYLLRKEGYEVAVAETGPDGAGGVRPQRRRPRAARPHAARPVRHRGVPRAAAALERAGDHADRQGQRDRQGRRARDRRRRLRHQALLQPRAAGPHQGGAAPAAGAGGAGPADARGRAGADGRRAARRHRQRRARRRCRSRSSSCSRCCCATPVGC